MAQGPLEALILATMERDILLNLNDDDLAARFANQADCRMLL